MYSHIMVGANDLDASVAFYNATMGVLGAAPATPDETRAFWATPTGMFAVSKPINGEPACAANGGTIGFLMQSPEQADEWHRAGVENGGTTCEDPPGWRDGPFGKMYLAYLRDPAGNKLCAFHRPA